MPPRLYLITEPISDFASYLPLFSEALGICDVACVLLRIEAEGDAEKERIVRTLAPSIQTHGAACLVANDPQLAIRGDTDGVHMDRGEEQLEAALRALKPDRIVGAGGLKTRHAAMIAGEAGADYVMFGGPRCGEPQAAIVERVAWWAELFNVPCVGYAPDLGAIDELVRANADFIALGDAVFADPRGTAAALHDAAGRISRALKAA